MALTLVTVVSINGDTSKAGSKVLNTKFITEVKTFNTTGARFRFMPYPDNRRGGSDIYVVSESRATLLTAVNLAPAALGLSLNVYPENSASNSAVAAVFNADEITKTYPNTTSDRTKSWIEVAEKGTKLRRYLTAHYYINIMDLQRYGTTTTTSSTTS